MYLQYHTGSILNGFCLVCVQLCIYQRIYILVIEATALPSSYKDVTLHACSGRWSGTSSWVFADRAGRGWVSHSFVRRWRVLSLLSLLYTVYALVYTYNMCFARKPEINRSIRSVSDRLSFCNAEIQNIFDTVCKVKP